MIVVYCIISLSAGVAIGRIWETYRQVDKRIEAYRSLLSLIRTNPQKAESILADVLAKVDQ